MLRPNVEHGNGSGQAVAAVACFVIAILAGIAGTVFTTGWILNPERHPSLHAIGLVLLILAFPILILGAHCLDLRDRKQNISGNDSRVQEPGETLRVVSRGTAFRVDSVFLNMAGFYVRKKPTEQSRLGVEATAHAGKDAEVFGFSATAPNIGGYKILRQLGPTNVSYLAPVGRGLTLQAGIFGSLIGYDSLYAKDNLNYTRPWGADFTPYFMMGANASYSFSENVTGTTFLINCYWHLARANNVPSSGGQIAYKVNPHVTVKETVLFGPHQSNTAFEFWRFLTDTIVERKTNRFTTAFEYTYSQERLDAPGKPRALIMSSQAPLRWTIKDRWSLSIRPEVFWDRDGRWTLARQTVKAFTTTLEYRLPYRTTNSIFRLEHRFDNSRGPEGGFFRGREVRPGVVVLTPNQHLLIFATIFSFDH